MEGGERGIKARDDDAVEKLRILAKSDFKHDFGEGVESRDKFVEADLARFEEIAQRYGIGKVKALTTGFKNLLGSNPYAILKDSIPAQIYPDAGREADYMDESAVMDLIGLNYDRPNGLKSKLKAERDAARVGPADPADKVFRPYPAAAPLTIRAPGNIVRSYEVTAVLVKDKGGEGTLNIASRFQNVTGGKTKFAMIIDASGGLSMTSVQNTDLGPMPTAKCDFYIIENIENDSDSATKLKHIDAPKNKEDRARLDLMPNLYFLKDDVDTVVYPIFKTPAELEGEALFGNANLVLSRTGDDTEADFTFADKTYHIDSVSQNANVKNASLNILAARLAEEPGSKQQYLYPYIKRVGDWCQALSLLDTSRPYRFTQQGGGSQVGGADPITLESLRKEGVVIAALTLDRILLAYLLSLGLDVFFTTATDLRMLIYFRNMESEMTPEQLRTAITKSEEEFNELKDSLPEKDIVPSILDAAVSAVQETRTDIDYIIALRSALYRISVLRTSYSDLTARLTKHEAELAAVKGVNPKEYNRLLFDGILIINKIINDHKHNQTQQNSLATYPNLVNDRQEVYNLMALPRPSRNAIAKLKVILSKDMHNDVIQCKKIFTTYGGDISNMFRPAPFDPAKFGEIWNAFGPEFRVQKGGGAAEINEALNGLRQFEITPVTKAVYDAAADRPDLPLEIGQPPAKDLPTLAILGTYYRDEKGFPYSVVDKYLVTKETLPLFDTLFAQLDESRGEGITPEDMAFVTKRYLILRCDLLQAAYEKLLLNDDDEPVDTVKVAGEDMEDGDEVPVESDLKFSEHKRIYYQAALILYHVTRRVTAYERFIAVYNDIGEVNLLDDATIDAQAVGRFGLRKNDYEKTRAKIQTVRDELINPRAKKPENYRAQKKATAAKVLNRLNEFGSSSFTPVQYGLVEKAIYAKRSRGEKLTKAERELIGDEESPPNPNAMDMDGATGGGLQTRRALYGKHVGDAADGIPRNQPGLNEGLRKRPKPRRTARVRQSTHKSRTRRQRKSLDRL